MFKPLGLFQTTRCPDSPCHRPYCFFSHTAAGLDSGASSPTPVKRNEDGQVVKKRKVEVPTEELNGVKKERTGLSADSRNASSGVKAENKESMSSGTVRPAASMSTSGAAKANAVSVARPAASATASARPPASSAGGASGNGSAAAAPAINATSGPVLPRDLASMKKSPQPYNERQKALTTLYTQFAKLYRPLGPNHPQLAAKHALAQEAETSAEMPALASYKRSMHHAAVSVLRRPAPDSIKHPSVGTLRESRAKVDKATKEALSKLSLATCSKYVLPLDEYADWGYPDYTDELLITPPEVQVDATGTEQKCDRCQALYTVAPVRGDREQDERMGQCRFHFGKLQPKTVEGRRKWSYSCCDRDRGETGCQEGLHVFRHKDDDPALARREPYKRVKQVCEEVQQAQGGSNGTDGWLEIVAIDCEMISGLSLARATVVDEKGIVILDEIVRQKASIMDVNTRFSGLKEDDVNNAVLDLEGVRKAVCMFVGPETIIVGHGLENDLRALRLLHDTVIDTAILLPHPKGKPFRRALRDLVQEKLGYAIQGMISDKGHSSAEDAQATLEVLKWKVRDDATPIDQGMLRVER